MTIPGALPYAGTTDERLRKLERERGKAYRDLSMLTIVHAAEAQGGTVEWLTPVGAWMALGDRKVPLFRQFGGESAVGAAIATSKWLSKELLAEAGVRVPRGAIVRSSKEAIETQAAFGKPLVVKPIDGALGRGVSVRIEHADEIRAAYDLAANATGEVLVEEFVEGDEYRIHATPSRYIGAYKRLPPSIVGDGSSTVLELIEAKNLRRNESPAPLSPIPINEITANHLKRIGISWDHVPDEGEQVVVLLVSSPTTGGDSEACGDSLPPEAARIAVDAVSAIPGMPWAGLDVLVDRDTGEAFVIEVNCNAAIDGASFPVFGEPLDMAAEHWHEYFQVTGPRATAEPEGLTPCFSPTVTPIEVIGRTRAIDDLAREYMGAQGYRVETREGHIWTAQKPGGPLLWYVGSRGTNDLRVASQVLRERRMLFRALDRNRLPRPESTIITGLEQLDEHRHHVDRDVLLLPGQTHNCALNNVLIPRGADSPAEVFERWPRWVAQPRYPGQRFRIFATPEKAILAVAPAQQAVPTTDVLSEVSRLAVRTIRALPQLRWAVVDILMPNVRPQPNVSPLLIEDVAYRAVLRSGEAIVGGSISELLDIVVSSSQ